MDVRDCGLFVWTKLHLWSDSPFDFNNTNNHSWTLHVACCERLVAPSNATHNRAAESRPQASNTSSAHTSWGMHVFEKRRGKQTFVGGAVTSGAPFQKKKYSVEAKTTHHDTKKDELFAYCKQWASCNTCRQFHTLCSSACRWSITLQENLQLYPSFCPRVINVFFVWVPGEVVDSFYHFSCHFFLKKKER